MKWTGVCSIYRNIVDVHDGQLYRWASHLSSVMLRSPKTERPPVSEHLSLGGHGGNLVLHAMPALLRLLAPRAAPEASVVPLQLVSVASMISLIFATFVATVLDHLLSSGSSMVAATRSNHAEAGHWTTCRGGGWSGETLSDGSKMFMWAIASLFAAVAFALSSSTSLKEPLLGFLLCLPILKANAKPKVNNFKRAFHWLKISWCLLIWDYLCENIVKVTCTLYEPKMLWNILAETRRIFMRRRFDRSVCNQVSDLLLNAFLAEQATRHRTIGHCGMVVVSEGKIMRAKVDTTYEWCVKMKSMYCCGGSHYVKSEILQ